MERINRSHKSRDINSHIKGKAEVTEVNAENSPVKDIKWDVQQAEVHSDISFKEDDGSGRPIILRQFDYVFPPGNQHRPSEDDILTPGYLKFLEAQLYFVDELDLVQKPKVMIGKDGFKIFATCQARKGSIIPQSAYIHTLGDIAKDHNDKSSANTN